MELLYISSLSSRRIIDYVHSKTQRDPGFAVQKFNRLIVKGLLANNVSTLVFSNPPMNAAAGKTWISLPDENEDGINYKYVKYFNYPILKDLFVLFNTFIKVLKWGRCIRDNKAVVCDVLSISANIGAILASKILGLKTVGIVTDMPGLMIPASVAKQKKGILSFGRFYSFVNKSYLHAFSFYVFLTEQMNEVINVHKRPFIVMEGLCDSSISKDTQQILPKADPKVIMYAGGLHEKYGLKHLVDAFLGINREDIRLVIYGSGPYSETINSISQKDSRIDYRGTVSNDVVLKTELEATLLVNPRPTNEEFTKFSFPSKNIEYMASGTPLLTTKLPGMPKEYYPHVYLIEDESVDGYRKAIENALSLPPETLLKKGLDAKIYILENKNNIIQSSRIVQLINP